MKAIFHNRLVIIAKGSEELFALSDLLANVAENPMMSLEKILELANELELNANFYDKVDIYSKEIISNN